MSKPLVIVESPAKIRTLQKHLGKEYNVAATVGHIMDLPSKEIGVDIDNGFKPKYTHIPGKTKVISSLKKAAGNTVDIYLAPDPDREGEAIAWHAAEALKKKGRRFHRILFHELTKTAVLDAIKSPMKLDPNKYEAQKTRRILDRLVGYRISPLLWRKVKGGLSAGRVQSVTVRIICERERAIHAFVSEEYWSITSLLEADAPPPFTAKNNKKNNKKIAIPNQEASSAIVNELANEKHIIDKVVKKTTKKNPPPPFITSTLQQEAIKKLRFTAKKTMMTAQRLYEGVDLGPGEPVGLITYMRTDSVRISAEAANEALAFIKEAFGDDYAPARPRFFKNAKKAQDAHEAIRPTSVFNSPKKIASFLTKDQLSLYTLIWKRFVASQMSHALIDKVSITVKAGAYQFSAGGSTVKFPGFMALHTPSGAEKESEKKQLPKLREGMEAAPKKIEPKQHFTAPPPRFSEASLVKELEENGIGRPSTYAAILSTIRNKGYVDFISGYFRPSELGFIVNDLLVENFPDVVNVDFTARMEDTLDKIEAASESAPDILSKFYGPFNQKVDAAAADMLNIKGVGFSTELKCPECGVSLHLKVSKYGPYLACDAYPDCSYTSDYVRDEKGVIKPMESQSAAQAAEQNCSKCDSPMVVKRGKFGEFLACSKYPDCKNTRSINSGHNGKTTGVKCPEKKCDGDVVERKSKRGKIFYGCSAFPECKFATWDKPVAQGCPQCDSIYLLEKTTKKSGTRRVCPDKACGYTSEKII